VVGKIGTERNELGYLLVSTMFIERLNLKYKDYGRRAIEPGTTGSVPTVNQQIVSLNRHM